MDSLGNKHLENIAGIYGLMLALTVDISAMPALTSNYTYAALPTLKSGKSWGVIEITDDSGSFSDQPKKGSRGVAFRPAVSISVPKLEPDVMKFMDTYIGAAFVMAVGDRNGQSYMIGSVDRPARLNVKGADSGSKPGDANATVLELYAYSDRPLVFCAVPLVPDPTPPRKVFSPGFTFGFLRV